MIVNVPMNSTSVQKFLAAWHLAIERKDLSIMDAWVVDDVVLNSPALFRPKHGKKVVTEILRDVLASLDGYKVTKTWIDGSEILLEFDATVGGMTLQGVDRITLNSEGQMTRLKVFIRPFKGLQVLIAAVVARNIGRMSGPRKLIARVAFAIKSRG